MRVGIDFGTTNSSIASFDGSRLSLIQLDSSSDNPHVLPSLIYIDHDYEAVVGTEAATEYLERETGRPVRWEKRYVGEIDVMAAGRGGSYIHYIQDVHAMVDTAANGRLLQSVKTGLRDRSYEGTQIFDRFYTIDELISIILRSLKVSAERQLGEECNNVIIGRPVRFSDDAEVTARAEEILFKAALFAGFEDIRFQMEPIGVAYLHHRSSSHRDIALVFDFGGGTLDLTVAEVGGALKPKILATRGVLVGGDDLDRRIMQSLLKYFGAGSTIEGDQPFPPDILAKLSSWQTMPDLSRPYYRRLIEDFKKTSSNPKAMRALETLVTRNLGFKLFKEIERAKKRLSKEPATTLDFVYGDIEIHEKITRQEFEAMIQEEIKLVEEGVRQVVADAGLKPSQVDLVLRTGGTSAVPVFTRLLATIFGEEKLREMDLLTSVVGGLAVIAHEEGGWTTPYAARYATAPVPFISGIHVDSGKPYEQYNMRMGVKCYIDQPFTLSRVPVILNGLPAIRTSSLDKNASTREFLQFHLSKACRVYIAYDAAATSVPKWLRSFTPESMQIEVDRMGAPWFLQVYGKDFPAGTVVLGGNRAPGCRGDVVMNYLVAVRLQL